MEAFNKDEPECTFQPQTYSGSVILEGGMYVSKPAKTREFH